MGFVHRRIISAVKMLEFVSGRMSYTVLRGRRWDIIITITILGIIHRALCCLKTRRFGDWIVSAYRWNLLRWTQ
jgi:hypothetical protein